MSDIRKWFMKQHDKGNGTVSKPEKPASTVSKPEKSASTAPKREKATQAQAVHESSGRRKTSKYFASTLQEPSTKPKHGEENKNDKTPIKRTTQQSSVVGESSSEVKTVPSKKPRKNDDDDFELPSTKKILVEVMPKKEGKRVEPSGARAGVQTPDKKPKSVSVKKVIPKSAEDDEDDEEIPASKSVGRGSGGRGAGAVSSGGRGRGGGRGGFMNFGERKDPPHKGEKEVPEGAPDCLAGLTFVISGTLDSLEREEAEDLIKRHGGRVTGSISKKTNYLLADEDIGGRKSSKAKELGTAFLTEDGLFDMIRKSKPAKTSLSEETKKKNSEKIEASRPKSLSGSSLAKVVKDGQVGKPSSKKSSIKQLPLSSSPMKQKAQHHARDSLTWTEKYRPKVPNDIIGNQSLVNQLREWLVRWNDQFLHTGSKSKGKKQNDSTSKKAVLISGSPGIGKSTTTKLVSKMLGFQAIEVNASDNRGKADAKIFKGIGGNTSNSIKELVSNEALGADMDWSKHPKSVLIMDEVDGMSAGDRGGVTDLIASIKISKIPIICICNDRYSQKLKSLVNYCLQLNFRKPTKQQMAKRLLQIANAEGLRVDEVALEQLAERVNGDMRLAINQLQYMALSLSVIKYADIKDRFHGSAKDEDISPFVAVDKLFGYNAGKLRMDERIDLSMSDPDLVPLIIQENYINYRPSSCSKDDSGVKRMNLIAHAAESIGDGDIVNVQIRRYRQWQLSQTSSLACCIIPAALMHGQREIFEQGERNFNRFGGWLGKNSTMGKNLRLLEDLHVHVIASRESNTDRATLRVDYFTLLLKRLTDPLRLLPKDTAVQKVVEFMDAYSISQEDVDTIMELSKFQGQPNPLEGVPPAVKAALTKAYKQGSSSRVVRAADLITIPGVKKAPKKRIAAILEPAEITSPEEGNADGVVESEESSSDTEDPDSAANGEEKLQLDLRSINSKGIQVQLDLKSKGNSNSKPASASTGKSKGSGGAKRKK